MSDLPLQEKLDEIATMVVMLHPNDSSTIDLVGELLRDLQSALSSHQAHAPLEQAIARLLEKRGALDAGAFIAEISKFVSNAQAYSQDLKPDHFNETPPVAGWGNDISAHLDQALVIEFIEKHSALLDDLEARLMEGAHLGLEPTSAESVELQRFLKGYLHNIKGDAGSVGLLGVERVTHAMEEVVLPKPPLTVLDELLAYREWVLATLRAFTESTPPKVNADRFLAMLAGNDSPPSSPPMTSPDPRATQSPVSAASQSTPPSGSKGAIDQTYQIAGDIELLNEFLTEAEDHLNIVEELLLAPKASYSDEDLNAIFRAVHSIKGGSAYFSLKEISKTSHAAENLMDQARKGKVAFGSSLKAIVLRYIDLQRTFIASTREALERDNTLVASAETGRFLADLDDLLSSVNLMEHLDTMAVTESTPPVATESTETTETKAEAAAPLATATDGEKSAVKGEKVDLKTFVKVDTDRLDRMIEYIGEMVISSSTLIRSVRDLLGEHENVVSNSNQLERISREIQEIGMSMRLVPIKSLFQKMSRVVWDTAKKLKKEVIFEMSGEETELDRTVIERLADPLMHMVRNAVDHGVETTDERVKVGKSKNGEVSLSAYQAGGNIYIQVRDDGKGLDPEKLVAHARKKGILSPDAKLSRDEAFMLIFAPGFSTAQVVTDVSGRGVGMDVVRRNIESMRGRITIQSEVGKGSLFTIELPLTLAITEGLETQVGNERYVIPTLSVVEFLRPKPDMVMRTLDRGETLKFRGTFLPIFRLARLYDITPCSNDVSDCIAVIVESGGRQVALLVDDILGKLSVVVKSLGTIFEGVDGLGGCAVMPDGSVGLILDVGGLISLAHSGAYHSEVECSVDSVSSHAAHAAPAQ